MKHYFSFMVVLIMFFALTACKQQENIVANVGSEKITEEMFIERVNSAPPAYQAYVNSEQGKKQFIDLLVREKLIVESAKQAKIDKTQEYKDLFHFILHLDGNHMVIIVVIFFGFLL